MEKTNTVILSSDHRRSLRKHSRWHWAFHGLSVLVILGVLAVPWVWKLDRDLVTEAYRVAKVEFENVLAKQELLAMLRSRSLTIGQALDIADTVINQKDVPIPIVLAVIAQESNFKPEAVSEKGARGLMQIMKPTYTAYSQNPLLKNQIHDPISNVKVGITYLAELHGTYKEWPRALRGFYAGPSRSHDKQFDNYAVAVLSKAEKIEKQIGR